MKKYNDIINLSRPESKHPRMSLHQRSAQFAPFAALTGYNEQVSETARITENKIEIDDEIKNELDSKFLIIKNKINEKPKVSIKYFIKDTKKSGGKYETVIKNIKKLDEFNYRIIFTDNSFIDMKDIYEIDILTKK